jgi:predicted transcriptional regulator
MDAYTNFSFRLPEALDRDVAEAAELSGLTKSEYARRALEEFNHRQMQERIGQLSTLLSAQSAAAAAAMDEAVSDGLE